VPRHTAHHLQHALIVDALIFQTLDQSIAGPLRSHADALMILAA